MDLSVVPEKADGESRAIMPAGAGVLLPGL